MEEHLKDLVFELSDFEGFKLCLCVCDDDALQVTLAKQVVRALQKQRIRALELSSNTGDLVQQLKLAHKNSEVALLERLDSLSEADFDEQMRRLNFQRDALVALGMPIAMWVSNYRLRRLATVAPDLWSRRTATYQFSASTIDKLIRALFISPPVESNRRAEGVDLVRVINALISAEQRLKERATESGGFDDNDHDVQIILESLHQLIEGCEAGRSLEVALDLANLTPLDFTVRRMRTSHPSLPLGNMYDAVLEVAPFMTKLLMNFRDNLVKRLRMGKKVSLLAYFHTISTRFIQRALGKSIRAANFEEHFTPEELDDVVSEGLLIGSFASFENALAARQLVDWLQGDDDVEEVQNFFTSEEREMLRVLVNSDGGRDSTAVMKLEHGGNRRMLRELQQKVANYLGISC